MQLGSPVSDLLNNLSARATVTLVTAIIGISVGNVEKLLIFVHKAKPIVRKMTKRMQNATKKFSFDQQKMTLDKENFALTNLSNQNH